jgi:hypothetical protein
MEDYQDQILCHSYCQQIPKSVQDKVLESNEQKLPKKDKKHLQKQGFNGPKQPPKNNDVIVHKDKSHLRWTLRDSENFTTTFYASQRKCPKTSDGQSICIKFFIHSICDASCTRAHKLSKDNETAFDKFVQSCCEANKGANKPDF